MGGSHSNKLIFLIFNMLGLIDMKIMRISTPYTPKDANKKSHLTFCFLKAKTRFFMTHVFCNAFCFLFGVVFLIGLLRLICLPWEFNLQLVCAGACRSSQDSHIPICIYLSLLCGAEYVNSQCQGWDFHFGSMGLIILDMSHG